MIQPFWLPVVNYEGLYEVSQDGRVRRTSDHQELIPTINWRWPRWYVRLTKDGNRKPRSVHALVAEAFLGPRPPGAEVCHNDGDRDNNCLSNLRYASHSDNMRDAVDHGTHSMARRKTCPRGHDIRDDRNARIKGSKRECLACSRTLALASYHRRNGRPWTNEQILADADARFQELVRS